MICFALVLALLPATAAYANERLSDPTRKAFDEYVRKVEAQVGNPAMDQIPGLRARVMKGEIVALPFVDRKSDGPGSTRITDGLVNHWFGAMYIPGVTIEQVKKVMQNYSAYSKTYAPEVSEAKLLKGSGEDFDVFLRLYRPVRIKALLGYGFPLEFNTNHRISYTRSGDMMKVRSISTRIAQVRDPKKSHTEEFEVENDSGYLWRLNSYWRVWKADNGVLVECEAVALSRSVPKVVEKIVTTFTTNFPEESMKNTLRATRDAMKSPPTSQRSSLAGSPAPRL